MTKYCEESGIMCAMKEQCYQLECNIASTLVNIGDTLSPTNVNTLNTSNMYHQIVLATCCLHFLTLM